jgi:hypothetical protein
LGRGRAQGDNISPNTFNFGEQILLFKIELDDRIRSIRNGNIINANIPVHMNNDNNSFFMYESQRETGKNESLADDNTTITRFETESLYALKSILDGFAKVSGLKCNFDKTMVMPVGTAINQHIDTAGFSVTNKIKLLGLTITNEADNFTADFEGIYEKIQRIINFWVRFHLSLPGRLAVAKTLMIPQINYLGCFLDPGKTFLDRLQTMIDEFILGRLNISKERLYLPPDRGGLGFFNLETFLTAQRCSWISRTNKLTIDNWRYDLVSLSPNGYLTLIRPCDVDVRIHPILFNIVSSFSLLLEQFTEAGNNYRNANFVDNPTFVRSAVDNRMLEKFFLEQCFTITIRIRYVI